MATIGDSDFLRLVSFVREKYGINLERKRQLIDARLSFDISKRGFAGFGPYVAKVIADPNGEEGRHMMNKLSTNYTFFFREADYAANLCGPVLAERAKHGRTNLSIWCAACSSGQEAYSIAMILELQRRLSGASFDFQIVGTDINTEMLEAAAKGVYPLEELEHIPLRYRPFVTQRQDHTVEISQTLRRKVTWRYENLMNEMPTGVEYDIVFCRNVMIYFAPQLRREMTRKLYSALLPGGYLFTGATESIDLERKYFRYIAPTFYQKGTTPAIRRET